MGRIVGYVPAEEPEKKQPEAEAEQAPVVEPETKAEQAPEEVPAEAEATDEPEKKPAPKRRGAHAKPAHEAAEAEEA